MTFETTILVDYSAEHIRTALRAYFTIFALLIGFIGNSCSSLLARLSIVRDDHVPLGYMTGWLPGMYLITYGWKLRTLPGGWLGLLMIIVTALSWISDLAVAGLVKGVQVPQRCQFGQGLVLNASSSVLTSPSPNGAPVYVVTQAQATSLNNTGLQGIYKKVNNATNFRADEDDYLGSWTCVDQGTTNFDTSYTASEIVSSLQTQGLLYDGSYIGATANGPAGNQFDTTGDFTHLVAWSSSLGDDGTGEPFEVRASVDLAASEDTVTAMWSFHCTMDASRAEYITSIMHSQDTLASWALYFQGSVYYGADTTAWPNTGEIIARLLNTMTMVSGGLNSLQAEPVGNDTDTTQGCLAPRTSIPVAVSAMVLILGVIALFVCLLYVLLQAWIMIASHERQFSKQEKKQISQAPNDLVDWMTHAVKETVTGGGQKSNTIKTWNFGRDAEGYGLLGPEGPPKRNFSQHWANNVEIVQRGKIYRQVDGGEF
jgi:hypothetical protein